MQAYPQPDPDLLHRLRRGDETALATILQQYKKPVLNFVYRLLGNAADAEDIAQEVFIRVHQHAASYRPAQRFSTWLFAIARHAAIDHLRWRQRHPTESLTDLTQHRDAEPTPDTRVTQTEVGEQIAAAIALLPEDQRTAVILSEYHDLADAEIASVMKCSQKSVEARLYRARQTLQSRLRHLLDQA